ncbi:acyl-CoA dehydrogenase family protein [Streptomyces sp. NPDC059070]|uniref:acyl-CoA dehydrogenase family protein n=1 Tax=unclassified Streptomyces TaxID=2593676 RepID=UPI0034E2FFFD
MRFLATAEQRDFTRALDALLTAADTPSAVRAWSAGDHGPGRALWHRLGGAGTWSLAAPEAYGGPGRLPVELAFAHRELGRHAVPGPVVETAAATALLTRLAELGEPGPAARLLPALLTGEAVVTLGLAASGPRVLDPDAADAVLVADAAGLRLAPGHGPLRASSDPARRLAEPDPGGELLAKGPQLAEAVAYAVRWARLAAAAQALGVAEELLGRTVAHVKRRTQFGVPIGSFQAVKHRLADTLLAVEFARPLVYGAALTLAPGDLAAAKTAAGECAYRAARTALQLHGAVGYTEELPLALWLRKARPLRDAWGTPAVCRAEVLAHHGGLPG